MDLEEKKAFIRELSDSITESLLELTDKMPEEWDGHELRCLLAFRYELSAKMTVIRREPRSKRARDFKNELIVGPW